MATAEDGELRVFFVMAAKLEATILHEGGAGSESMSKLALIDPIFLYLSFINLVMLLVQSFGGDSSRNSRVDRGKVR